MFPPLGFFMTEISSVDSRSSRVERNTKETQIEIFLNLDGSGKLDSQTSLPFLDHMLDQIARHGLMDITIKAKGDLEIDAHHTVEDIGITLGQAFNNALDKTGIRRYGHAYVPLDEALSRVVLDIIIPSTLNSKNISHIILRSSSLTSGDIFINRGTSAISLFVFRFLIFSSKSFKFFSICNSLKPGVFGEEILIVIYET